MQISSIQINLIQIKVTGFVTEVGIIVAIAIIITQKRQIL